MSCTPEEFPPLWQKPAFGELMDCLQKLRIDPPVWNYKVSRRLISKEQETQPHVRREVTSFLSGIIKSSLEWVEDEDEREDLWTEASKRMSERCGRAAMGEIIRQWPFDNEDAYNPFQLAIREPPLAGDGDTLGLKTWGSSYLLALMLHRFTTTSLAHLLPFPRQQPVPVLELGSGTGLLGLAAAAIWQADVTLTDLPSIMPNLAYNTLANAHVVEEAGGSVKTGALTWGGNECDIDPALYGRKHDYKIILVADPLYDNDHPSLLANTIHEQLSIDEQARALVMVPQRDSHTLDLLNNFRALMVQDLGFVCAEEGTVAGQDDWEQDHDADDDETPPPQAQCWWGLFRWAAPPAI